MAVTVVVVLVLVVLHMKPNHILHQLLVLQTQVAVAVVLEIMVLLDILELVWPVAQESLS